MELSLVYYSFQSFFQMVLLYFLNYFLSQQQFIIINLLNLSKELMMPGKKNFYDEQNNRDEAELSCSLSAAVNNIVITAIRT